MKLPKVITVDEIKPTIMVPNPGNRAYSVTSEESGYEKDQYFTSAIFPEQIPGQYIGLMLFPDKKIHPIYSLEVSNKPLILSGTKGFNNGIRIMHSMCNELIYQKGILFARNISELELSSFKSDFDKKNYWLASTDINIYNKGSVNLIIKGIFEGTPEANYLMLNGESQSCEDLGVKPIIALKSRVEITDKDPEINWIKL